MGGMSSATAAVEKRWDEERRVQQLVMYLFDAMLPHIRAVPRDGPGELPPHDLVVEAPVSDKNGDVLQAIERNLGAIARLLPEQLTLVTREELRVILAAASLNGLPGIWSADSLHARGLELLDAYGAYRGQQFDADANAR